MFIELPVKVHNHALGYALNGWQISGTAFWHSGIPFSVLSTPYSANGNGIVQGSGRNSQVSFPASRSTSTFRSPGVTQPGTSSGSIRMRSCPPSTRAPAPATAATTRRIANSATSGRNALRGPDFVWSDFYLTKWFSLTEHVKLRLEAQFFNVFNHPNFGLPSMLLAGVPGQALHPNRLWRAHLHHFSADRPARRRPGRRQLPAHDRLSSPPRILKPAGWWCQFVLCAVLSSCVAGQSSPKQ